MTIALEEIRIGWIFASPISSSLVRAIFDEVIKQYVAPPPGDNNIYTYGRINIAGSDKSHIVAITQLRSSSGASVATVVNDMRRSFPKLQFCIIWHRWWCLDP
jgi:hypothetical protein